MVAVGSRRDGCEVVVEVFSGEQAWAVGKGNVVLGVAFFGGRRGGDQEDCAGTPLEEDDFTQV